MPKLDTNSKISMYMLTKPAKKKLHRKKRKVFLPIASVRDVSLGACGTAKVPQQMGSTQSMIESPEGIELLAKLLAFDNDSSFGPCVGAPRLLRWERAQHMNLNPPKDILPILESLKDEPDHPWYYSRMTHLLNSTSVTL
ncbi:hypothetical protein C8J55DRAFT_142451 [Lentinula edodes]|uniref:DNA polymerase delta subunit 4 n=1 Tax=Lentinula lateritia TaxID=40482 RepID=A0A9W9DIY9_9AGAR|nr:hypothetical protein C8J55DRAFT_285330 [Lentinula edodes]KAJ4472854.1 hypothetical protein C8J55DRAFT_142451 [Lentinula edodes]